MAQEGTSMRGPKIMTADLVGVMPKVNRHLRPRSDTTSRACKSDSESAGITTSSAWSYLTREANPGGRKLGTRCRATAAARPFTNGLNKTFGLTHQHQTIERACLQPKRCRRLRECRRKPQKCEEDVMRECRREKQPESPHSNGNP